MSEGGQVARRPHRTLGRHDRVDPEREEGEEAVDELGPAAAVAEGQGVRAQQQHRPHDLTRERRPDADRVADQQVLLEFAGALGRDRGAGQIAEARRHPVDHGSLLDQALDDVAGFLHPRAGMDIEGHRDVAARDGLDVGDGQVRPGEDHGRRATRHPGALVRISMRPQWFGHDAEDSGLCCRPCSTS